METRVDAKVKDYSWEILKNFNEESIPIVLWGVGGMFTFIYDNLKQVGIRLDYIVENNLEKCGKKIKDVPIISFKELVQKEHDCRILIGVVTPKYVEEIKKQIALESNFEQVYFIELFYPFGIYAKNVVNQNKEEINEVINFLADDKSKMVFQKKIQYILNKQLGGLDEICDNEINQYFDDEIVKLEDKTGIFIDGGAFHGENTDQLFKKFKNENIRSVCIDADEKNIKFMNQKYKNLSTVSIMYGALTEHNGKIYFDNAGDRGGRTSEFGGLGEEVQAIGIDDQFGNEHVCMIKLDIEGSEIECLKGARKIIQRDRPLLAICIYHSIEDHWKIPLLIKNMCPEYKFYIRHYHYMGIESVVYAV